MNYPPGFGSPRDLDHVEGPLSEDDVPGTCTDCGRSGTLFRQTWRTSDPIVFCFECDAEQVMPPAFELTDDGTLDTVIINRTSGKEFRFNFAQSVDFLADGDDDDYDDFVDACIRELETIEEDS